LAGRELTIARKRRKYKELKERMQRIELKIERKRARLKHMDEALESANLERIKVSKELHESKHQIEDLQIKIAVNEEEAL
jgi:chromosome segregation ATPase